MKKAGENKKILYIFFRYIFLILIALPNLFLFYFIFTPLTIYPVNFFLSLIYTSYIQGNSLTVNNIQIILVDACIAGSAYYLLILLNFSLSMPCLKRIKTTLFSLLIFLGINIIRIFIFTILFIQNFKYFDLTHKLFWYLVSGIIVFFVWLLTIKTYHVKNIPFYTDLKFLYGLTKRKPRSKKSK